MYFLSRKSMKNFNRREHREHRGRENAKDTKEARGPQRKQAAWRTLRFFFFSLRGDILKKLYAVALVNLRVEFL
jgi:hypothetical protein